MTAKRPFRQSEQRRPPISEAEWVVMRVLWAHGPLTTNQVVELLAKETAWKPQTVHTLLHRLVKKGFLATEKRGREHLYQPRVAAEDCEHALTRSFLDRFFGGQLAPFLARFVERERLSPAAIAELRRILDRKKR